MIRWATGLVAVTVLSAFSSGAPATQPADQFRKDIQPLLAQYCYDCHGDGKKKGGIAFDELNGDDALLNNRELWWRVLKNVRTGIMPPQRRARPGAQQIAQLAQWIKYGAFGLDPENPDPGRVTIRRLNRIEYRNTVRDLMGVDYNTAEEFPPDDTGYGFDTIGDVLSVSPMLLEKYMKASESIVRTAVPLVARTMPEFILPGRSLKAEAGVTAERMSFYKEAKVTSSFAATNPGEYLLKLALTIRGDFNFDPGRCDLVLKVDDQEQWHQEFKWDNGRKFQYEIPVKWELGNHTLTIELHPLTPPEDRRTSVDVLIQSLTIAGPTDERFWPVSKAYRRFFTRDEPPKADSERREYAREALKAFSRKAFRRPADPRTVDRLVRIAEAGWSAPGKQFEQGIGQAMVAALSSPRFLFRIEKSDKAREDESYSRVDEYALASRLSYFLWSTMPDDELMGLADRGELRRNYQAQVRRMMADSRSANMVRNFAGQWLQLRDLDGIAINARVVLARDNGTEKELQQQLALRARGFGSAQQQAGVANRANLPPGAAAAAQANGVPQTQPNSNTANPAGARAGGPTVPQRQFRGRLGRPAVELDEQLRQAMRSEPEMLFETIVREDRPLSDLLDCNYTFVNAALAKVYGMKGVSGADMRRVELARDSPRGGLLTTGSLLVVTSNPTRTSPVKRGQFILDNILGMPAPPPPAGIPPLEEAEKGFKDQAPTFRQVLELHRSKPLCNSCHARMDPLGLSLENFNALGMFREKERGQTIDSSGQLLTGESFHNVRDLKDILKARHMDDFYRCLTEKLLTYAIGRGLEYYDVDTVDRIVDRIKKEDGRYSALLMGIVESAPFQERRNFVVPTERRPEWRVPTDVHQ